MRFEEIRLRGFMSFAPEEQVLKLGKRGLVLVEGENRDDPTVDNNGSGKSTLSEAILWALFGETMRGKSGDEVVHRKLRGDGGCKVTVKFSNDKGETFVVERHRLDKAEKNRLLFTGPTGGLTANETAATEQKIREALGMDYDTFTNAVVFGQGQSKHFASMTDKEMKKVTDRLIGVEALAHAYKAAHQEESDLHDELSALQAEVKDLDNMKRDVKDAKAEYKAWDEEFERNKEKYEKQIAALKEPDFKALTNTVADAEKAVKKAEDEYDAARDVEGKASGLAGVAKAEVTRLKTQLDNVTDTPGVCDHCGSTVSLEDLGEHRNDVENALRKAKAAQKVADEEFTTAFTAREYKKTARDTAKKRLDAARAKLDEGKLESANHDKLRDMLKQFKQQSNPHVKAVERAEKALAEAETHNVTVEKAVADLKTELEVAEFIAAMFSDKGSPGSPPLKALLVESVAPFVNKKLAHYSRFLTEGNIKLTFETQKQLKSGEFRDEYTLLAKNRHGAEDYGGSSGGERRKIDATIFFAFQALAASRAREQVRFAVWDEVFDALDETAQEVMMELLLEEKSRKDTMLVITQRPELRAYFPTVVKVVKERGFSRIVR